MPTPDVQLQIAGTRYGGWESVRIRRSLDEVANTFRFSLTERWPGQQTLRPINAGQAAKVLVNGQTLVTGYVDVITPDYDADHHRIEVRGRSATQDLVDCSSRTQHFSNLTLLQLCQRICKPFGIPVQVQSGLDIGAPFPRLSIDAGQSYFEFLEHAARARAVRLITTPDGALELMRAGQSRSAVALELGQNIESAHATISWRQRFSDYIYLGQQGGTDYLYGNAAAGPDGSAADPGVTRHRPSCTVAQTPCNGADCKRLAQWQRQVHYGRSQQITYTVTDWYAGGALWTIGDLVPVRDAYMGLDGDRLIGAVSFILDRQGLRTEIEVAPRQAYDLVDVPDPDIKTGGILGYGG